MSVHTTHAHTHTYKYACMHDRYSYTPTCIYIFKNKER